MNDQQTSLTELFKDIKHPQEAALRAEDAQKWSRMAKLSEITGMPYCKPITFEASELVKPIERFNKILQTEGSRLCALRLNPKDYSLPKIRFKGKPIKEAYKWFKKQKIDPAKYSVDLLPFAGDCTWSLTFVVNKKGIFGEIVQGDRRQLAWGNFTNEEPISFSFNYKEVTVGKPEKGVKKVLADIFEWIRVENVQKRKALKDRLAATFAGNYLCGYFETTITKKYGLWFVDYNRVLGKAYKDFSIAVSKTSMSTLLKGRVGSTGKITGTVRIVSQKDVINTKLGGDEILVCEMTTPDYVALISQAVGIITDKGGTLSHAAVIARELGRPCLVATQNATKVLKNGQKILLDADNGVVIRN